jgi:hypothetical protein
MRKPLRSALVLLFILVSSVYVGGCAALGVAAHALPLPTIAPPYAGLQGQSVAVMIWAQPGTQIDWPKLRLDVGSGLQEKLRQAQVATHNKKGSDLDGTQFVRADSVVRYQEEHPEIDGEPIAEVAPRLGATRVIYIEIDDFQTRSDPSVELYRGVVTASVKVVEVADDGHAMIAYEKPIVRAQYPPKAPEEGIMNSNDFTIYRGTVDAFTTELAKLFIAHQEEEE